MNTQSDRIKSAIPVASDSGAIALPKGLERITDIHHDLPELASYQNDAQGMATSMGAMIAHHRTRKKTFANARFWPYL